MVSEIFEGSDVIGRLTRTDGLPTVMVDIFLGAQTAICHLLAFYFLSRISKWRHSH